MSGAAALVIGILCLFAGIVETRWMLKHCPPLAAYSMGLAFCGALYIVAGLLLLFGVIRLPLR